LKRVYRLDEGFKGSSYLTETLLDPEFGHSYESNKTAFNKALNLEGDMWTWFEAPGNELRLARFGAAMNGAKNMTSASSVLEGSGPAALRRTRSSDLGLAGYAWENLTPGSPVVDVGGGVGSQSLLLALHHPNLSFVVQDRDSVVGNAVEVCASNPTTSVKYRRCLTM
jgi:hypothetical protein